MWGAEAWGAENVGVSDTSAKVDRRIVKTRAKVLAAAQEVLLQHGFDGVTIDHISDRSGVSRSTIYRHWETREQILRDAFSFIALESEPSGPDLRADLRRYADAFARGLQHHWGRAAATLAVSALDDPAQRAVIATFRDGYVADVATIITRARERGETVDGDADPERTADLLTAPLFYRYLISHRPFDADFLAAVAESTHQALTAPPST